MVLPIQYGKPVKGQINDSFHPRVTGVFRVTQRFHDERFGGKHVGIDLGNGLADGAPVYAVASGKIILRRTGDGCIGILHADGTSTYYAHLRQPFMGGLVVGNLVAKGQQIGRKGGTGGVPEHLHFERHSGASLTSGHTDPWPWLPLTAL